MMIVKSLFFFPSCSATCAVFLELPRGTKGATYLAPGMSSLHLSCEGERGIALDSLQGNPALRRVEGGISRSFSTCVRKPWVSSTSEDDLRELLIVPIGSQEYCGLRGGLSDSIGFGAVEERLISC